VVCRQCKKAKSKLFFYKDSSRRSGISTICKKCDSIRRKAAYYKHHARELLGAKKRRLANPDRISEYNRKAWADPIRRAINIRKTTEWVKRNPEKVREYKRKSIAKDPLKEKLRCRIKAKKYLAKLMLDPKKKKLLYARNKAYRKRYREKVNEYNRRRFHITKRNGGHYLLSQWEAMVNVCKGVCLSCGKVKKLTVDHVLPVSLGGKSTIDNIQPLCGSCNSRKHNKHIDYRTKFFISRLRSKGVFIYD